MDATQGCYFPDAQVPGVSWRSENLHCSRVRRLFRGFSSLSGAVITALAQLAATHRPCRPILLAGHHSSNINSQAQF